MTEDLLFDNLVFHEGLNITVRRGDKTEQYPKERQYIHARSNRPPHDVVLCDLLASINLRFDEIPEGLLALEHDPTCQTFEGLLKELTRIYFTFNTYDLVTIIFFIPHLEDMKQQTLDCHSRPISGSRDKIIFNPIRHVDGC